MHCYILDYTKLEQEVLKRGFNSISQVAQKIGLHRNTIGNFSSNQPVLPKSLTSLFSYLDLDARQFIKLKQDEHFSESISRIVDTLIETLPNCCVVLFGSRARRTNKKFSDFDLGVYSKEGVCHSTYLKLLNITESLSEDFPIKVQLVNLTNADKKFLESISIDLKFLAGKMSDWESLKMVSTNV